MPRLTQYEADTVQRYNDLLKRKLKDRVQIEVLKLRDAIYARAELRAERKEAEDAQRATEKANAEATEKIAVLEGQLKTAQTQVNELQKKCFDMGLRHPTTEHWEHIVQERDETIKDLRTQLTKAEARLMETAQAVCAVLSKVSQQKLREDAIRKHYFATGHKFHDPIYTAFGITADVVEQWRKKESDAKSAAEWALTKQQNVTLSGWNTPTPPPIPATPREAALAQRPTVMEQIAEGQTRASEHDEIRIDNLPDFDIRDVLSEQAETETRKALIAGIDALLDS